MLLLYTVFWHLSDNFHAYPDVRMQYPEVWTRGFGVIVLDLSW